MATLNVVTTENREAGSVELDPAARGRRKKVRVLGDPEAVERRARELAGPLAGGATSD